MSKQRVAHHSRRTRIAFAALSAGVLGLTTSPAASAALTRSAYRAENVCAAPRYGSAGCLGLRLVAASLTRADLRSAATEQAEEAAQGVKPAVQNRTPNKEGL